MSIEVSEGLLYFLKYPLLLLLYLFLACMVRAMVRSLPTRQELVSREALPAVPVRQAAPEPASTPASVRQAASEASPASTPAGTPWLEVLAGMDSPPGGLPLAGPVLFGRSADCTVRVPDPFVSGHHSRLTPGPEGPILEDLGSRNGTWIGQDRLQGPVRLRDGDHFAVGDVTFRYHAT